MIKTLELSCGTVVRDLTIDGDEVATLVMTLPGVDGIRVVEAVPAGGPLVAVAGVRVSDALPVRLLLVTAPLEPADRRRVRVETAELEALLTHVDPELVAPLLDHGVDAAGRPYLILERTGPELTGPLDAADLAAAAGAWAAGLGALAVHGLVGPPPSLHRHRAGLRLDTPLPPALLDLVEPGPPGWTAARQVDAVARRLVDLASTDAPITAALATGPATVADLAAALSPDRAETIGEDTEAPVRVADSLPSSPHHDRTRHSSPSSSHNDGRPLGSRYLLDRTIGRGATGVVWAGRRRSDGGPVAVKLLRPELAEDPDTVTRFLRERRLLLGLRHPNLVRVLDLVAEGEALGIVMELIDGEDLRRLLGRGPVPDVFLVLAQVASALASVHAAGLIHRDIKPENVLVTRRDGQPVALLTDFGIARPADLATSTDLLGTPTYVAPELVAGRPPEPAVDVYAFGVMAYEVLTGAPPFRAPNTEALLRAHLDQPVRRPEALAAPVWDLLAACLAKSPAARPGATELALRWADLAGTAVPSVARTNAGLSAASSVSEMDDDREPTALAARPLPVRPGSAPVVRRRRWLLVTAGLVVLGLGAGVALAATGVGRSPATPSTTAPVPAQPYVIAAGLRLTGASSVTVTWGAQAAALSGFAGYVVVDVSGASARPVSDTLAADVTSFAVAGVRPGRESCYVVIAVGVRAPPPDPLPQPVCVTTPATP